MPKPTGFIFYQGPSELDGAPIVAIATTQTRNPKTGPMLQTWVMRSDVEPHTATRDGRDTSVCGSCPLRPSETGVCYVTTFRGPLAIYRAYRRNAYPVGARWGNHDPIHNRMVRLGAYGDPAAVPRHAWTELLSTARGWTGYTHQWRDPRFAYLRAYCQASCDTPADVQDAIALGWKTFYVVPKHTDRRLAQSQTQTLFHDCPAVTGRKSTTCSACGLCNGTRAHIIIDAHGNGAAKLPEVL